MWLDRIINVKKQKNISTKTIAEKSQLPGETVSRILNGTTSDPRLETVLRIGAAVGLNAWEIFADTDMIVGDQNLAELRNELEEANARTALLEAENNVLSSKAASLSAEVDLLRLQLSHKEELLAVHNYYNTIIGNMRQQ